MPHFTRSFLVNIIAIFTLSFLLESCRKNSDDGIVGVCPTVIATNPNNLAANVPLNQVISVTFNEKMNPATISQASISLSGGSPVARGNADVAGTVTYNDATNTMYFMPTAPLSPKITYSCKVYASVKDVNGNVLQTDYNWTFSTGSVVSPMVISTDPPSNATNVALNKVIKVDFSAPIDPSSINYSSFTLNHGITSVNGVFLLTGSRLSFTPTVNLMPGTAYSVTITSDVKNTTGNYMPEPYIWSFTTTSTFVLSPTVLSTSPANNENGVALDKKIAVSFSAPIDPSSINTNSFQLKSGNTIISGMYSVVGANVWFIPSANLIANTNYIASLTDDIKNTGGANLASNYEWSFNTGTISSSTAFGLISTDPLNNETNVSLTKVIKVNFDEAMMPFSINDKTFILSHGAITVAGVVNYSNDVASFTPYENLLSNTTYTATIKAGVSNISGTMLASDYVWSFSTVATLGPQTVQLNGLTRFGIIAGLGVSNNAGFSVINNLDVGISPGVRSSVVGFPPAVIVNGAIYASDDLVPSGTAGMLLNAKQDLVDAYDFARLATTPAPVIISGDQGGLTLAPGIYKSTSSLLIQAGDLTLDALGDENAVWIFQITSDLTSTGGAGGNVILTGNAQAKNIFWQVGSSAIIGSGTQFKGNVLALSNISMYANSVSDGRMLSRNGSVVMTDNCTINKP